MRNFSAQKLFFSCRGIDPVNGAMDHSEQESELRKVMMDCTDEVYLLCDSSKFDKVYFYDMGDISELDAVISDKPLPESLKTK